MARLLLFGGTTEGRLLAEFCAAEGISVTVSVATPAGASLLPAETKLLCGRLERAQMRKLLADGAFSRVVDATHPYAAEVTANLRAVCGELGIPYLRLVRETVRISGETVPDPETLVSVLNAREGVIFSALGSKSLPVLTGVQDFRKRLWVRILPDPDMQAACTALGYDPAHIIAEKPPFSVEQNLTHLRQSGASVLVTKESGITGGYPEKCEAARILGISVITLCRPADSGLTLPQVQSLLKEEMT